MQTQVVRHGDLLLIPCEPKAISDRAEVRKGGMILEGEATGHHHRVADCEAAEVLHAEVHWPIGAVDTWVRVGPGGVSIVHEEHKPVTLEPGVYEVHRAREFDYLRNASRAVRD